MANSNSTPSPQSWSNADRVRMLLATEALYPLDDAGTPAGDDGNPAAWLADISGKLDYADALSLYLCAERMVASPAAGFWQRRAARIETLMLDCETDPPDAHQVKFAFGFAMSLARRWLAAWLSRSWARRIVSRIPVAWALVVACYPSGCIDQK